MKRAAVRFIASAAPSEKRVLLVWHSRTGFAEKMADALEAGARDAAAQMGGGLSLARRRAADATADDVLRSDAYLFVAPENLASASGEMLEFFHRTYYHAFAPAAAGGDAEISRLLGRPYGLAVAAGSDGTLFAAVGTRASGPLARRCKRTARPTTTMTSPSSGR